MRGRSYSATHSFDRIQTQNWNEIISEYNYNISFLVEKCHNLFMSESSVQIGEEIAKVKKDLVDPRTISKNKDQAGRDVLASKVKETKKETTEADKQIGETSDEYVKRQDSLTFKLRSKLNKIDPKAEEIWQRHLEAVDKKAQLPNPKEMIDAYYEKKSTEPLTNDEKRELLKPEVLSQLSTEEYIALWKRLNPHFLTHVTRQGFRDHNAMFYHSGGMQEFHKGFENVMKDDSQLRPPLALDGLKNRDKVSVKMFLSNWVLQAENEEVAKERFDNLLHFSLGSAPKYPDKIAVHFATQLVADDYYGGEKDNEVFFVFPSDILASQHNFTFNGWEKDFTKPQSETKWNDVFVWPDSLENPGISIDTGIVFLPEDAQVDPKTGSKYASEVKIVDGKEQRVMVENTELIEKFMKWAEKLDDESQIIKKAREFYKERNYELSKTMSMGLDRLCSEELRKMGFDQGSTLAILPDLVRDLIYWNKDTPIDKFQDLISDSSARFKKAENVISVKNYWEKSFSEQPDLKPKHVVYYSGDPTNAIYKFQQENGIGDADTSKTEGKLLGFNDHHITDVENDPRANQGHDELVATGNKIIAEHYRIMT